MYGIIRLIVPRRATAAAAVAVLLPAILLTSVPIVSAPLSGSLVPLASAATPRIGAYGTATIDGVNSPGEWANADPVRLEWSGLATLDGRPADVTLFIMNDARNLYVAVRVSGIYDGMNLRLSLGSRPPRANDYGTDVLEVRVARTDAAPRVLPLYDRFIGRCGLGSCELDDTQSSPGNPGPGSTDGRAAGGFDLVSGYLELSHPLASGDTGHDIAAAPGRVLDLGVRVGLTAATGRDCSKVDCWADTGFDGGDLVLATAPAPFAPVETIRAAIRIEGATVTPGAVLPGTPVRVTFRLVNRSARAFVVPLDGATGHHVIGIVREGVWHTGDGAVEARQGGIEQNGWAWSTNQRPLDVLARLGGTVWPPGVAISLSTTLRTDGFGPGSYTYGIDLGPGSRETRVAFTVKGVTDEWTAGIGTSGRNGTGALRAYTTGDGSLGLVLRGLAARTSYPVAIATGTCGGAAVANLGRLTTSATGTAVRTIALAPATRSAVVAAARYATLYVRVGTGLAARCGRLTALPLFQGKLSWSAYAINDERSAIPAVSDGAGASGVAVVGSSLVAVGIDWKAGTPSGAVWASTDGYSWTETRLASSDPWPTLALAADGARAVAVGTGRAWHSSDGRTWFAAAVPPTGTVPTAKVVARVADGFLALLTSTATGQQEGATAWTSPDGERWSAAGSLDGFCPDQVLGSAGIAVAVGHDCASYRAAAMRSVDGGRTWARTDLASAGSAQGIAVVGDHFLAWGRQATWTSHDGARWLRGDAFPVLGHWDATDVAAVVPYGSGWVAVGTATMAADSYRSAVLVSGDGRTWKWAPWPPAWSDASMHAATVWNGNLFVVGEDGLGQIDYGIGHAVIWRAALVR